MSQKQRVVHVVQRVALVLSFLAAGLSGAAVAIQLRPTGHVVAARHSTARPLPPTVTATPRPPTLTATPTSTPIPTPLAPRRAMLSPAGGHATPSGAWLQSRTVRLRVTLSSGPVPEDLRAQLEIVPASLPFNGNPTVVSSMLHLQAGSSGQTPITVSGLMDGQRYHWRVRAQDASGLTSAWSGGGLFGVGLTAPLAPQLATTNVMINGWSRVRRPLFRWTDAGSMTPIAFFEYRVGLAHGGGYLARVKWTRTHGSVVMLPDWPQGRWRLQVRAVDLAGNHSRPSDWPFALARQAPPPPRMLSSSPLMGGWSNIMTPTVVISAGLSLAPIAGYEYALQAGGSGHEAPLHWQPLGSTTLALTGLGDGEWQVQLRERNVLGLASLPVTWRFHLDREHPLLSDPTLSLTSFTPPIERLHIRFGLGKAATIAYSILQVGKASPVRSGTLGYRQPGLVRDLVWDGHSTPKKLAPGGNYTVVISATDMAGNTSVIRSAPVQVLDKRIVISISKEALWAYQGNKLVIYSLVTNGGPDTPTLPGIFHVEGKFTGFVFHSPWPPGSPLWYPDSPTSYALLYNANGGYFLHDAPWRGNFGPGSNSVAGTPGGSYTGTHGCTNVPLDVMARLFAWADTGTLIQILS